MSQTRIVGAILLASGLALTACSSAADKATENLVESVTGADVEMNDNQVIITDEQGGELTIDKDGGAFVYQDENSDSNFQMGDDLEIPDSVPGDLPMPPSATLVVVSDTGNGVELMWNRDSLTEADFDTYLDSVRAAGFANDGEEVGVDFGGGMFSRMAPFTKDGTSIKITASVTEGPGQIYISIS
jgi:hypothetical protein